jgi:hypothetical protein
LKTRAARTCFPSGFVYGVHRRFSAGGRKPEKGIAADLPAIFDKYEMALFG